ncbi:MAG: ABC transporter permease [Eubacterium sp.]
MKIGHHTLYRAHFSERSLTITTVVIILGLWFLVTNIGSVSSIIIPSPQSVWKSFTDIVQNGYKGYSLWQHLSTSLLRLGIAYALVVVTAIPLGLLSGYNSKIRAILDPIIEFYRPLPPLAYYTILVLWLGIDESSKLALLFLAGFAPVYISCVAGVKRINQDYINGAKTLGASPAQIFFHVVVPASLPDVFTGLRTALGVEYTTLVAAEMVAATKGIGWMVLDASNYLRSDVVFMGVILMGITGILLDQIIRLIERKVVYWKGKN